MIGCVRKNHDVLFARAGIPEVDVRLLDDASAREVLSAHANDLSHAARERILTEAPGNPLALVELPVAVRGAAEASLDALPLTARLERAFAAQAPRPSTSSPTFRIAPSCAATSDGTTPTKKIRPAPRPA